MLPVFTDCFDEVTLADVAVGSARGNGTRGGLGSRFDIVVVGRMSVELRRGTGGGGGGDVCCPTTSPASSNRFVSTANPAESSQTANELMSEEYSSSLRLKVHSK